MQPANVTTFLEELVSEANVLGYYYTNDEDPEETQALYNASFDTFDQYRRDYVEVNDTMLLCY